MVYYCFNCKADVVIGRQVWTMIIIGLNKNKDNCIVIFFFNTIESYKILKHLFNGN